MSIASALPDIGHQNFSRYDGFFCRSWTIQYSFWHILLLSGFFGWRGVDSSGLLGL